MSKYRSEYDRIIKTKTPEVAVELLAMVCQEKDRRIMELKEEIKGKILTAEFGAKE